MLILLKNMKFIGGIVLHRSLIYIAAPRNSDSHSDIFRLRARLSRTPGLPALGALCGPLSSLLAVLSSLPSQHCVHRPSRTRDKDAIHRRDIRRPGRQERNEGQGL